MMMMMMPMPITMRQISSTIPCPICTHRTLYRMTDGGSHIWPDLCQMINAHIRISHCWAFDSNCSNRSSFVIVKSSAQAPKS
ncbi:uncharacterized protein ACLA_068970 [Aspergillus clavatus NRRL 1]|uniref:Uncharacterized protein n=1 Tax=Aspergillus clavatus (strain ATCC 1007 / CBS 513.65 / DSM 816 / NCTC 3887 / NRRL 1 / QM 1276 / 107) TaxID=344612 RepID=A1C648_ASPCL|nr:uncharacterized protein ACLA_068970 [Aspergillus clavatus NRRL 1]EAW13869.1 hypothetical protein ACLA_068970 [Aspergillus clavatus NRRL 1]